MGLTMTAGAMTLLMFSTALDTPFPIQLQKQASFLSARRETNIQCETNMRAADQQTALQPECPALT